MRRLLMASALAAGFMAGADGFGERAIAADDKGIWEASFDVTCVEFLQRSKDEAAARARVKNPERGVIYDRLYDRYHHYVLGMVNGFNAGRSGVANTFPKTDNATIVELVKRQCDLHLTINLPGAVLKAINANKNSWKLTSSAPNEPINQTGKIP